MDRYLVISSDCHAAPPSKAMREYLDPQYRQQYDESLGAAKGKDGGASGLRDPAARARDLDRDGVAGEVIFPAHPNGDGVAGVPFDAGMSKRFPYELQFAGARAYNRWLAEFCSNQPERHAGVILSPMDDVDAAVEEIKRARKSGLSGGVLLPVLVMTTSEPESFWYHPRYEPVWNICEELDLPVQSHAAHPGMEYGDVPGKWWITNIEGQFVARRPLWDLMFSGTLARHPKLNFGLTEAGGGDIVHWLSTFDYFYEARNPDELKKIMDDKPSDYWRRQCFVGASPHSGRMEVEFRGTIGVRNLLWGSAYPQGEEDGPYAEQWMKATFKGVPQDEVALMLGENAARVFNFDVKKLRPIADRIGLKA